MARLVVVSNRVPVPGDRSPAAGGLAIGLADAVTAGSLWFGWSGRRGHIASKGPTVTEIRGITYATIDLTEADYRHFYSGFSNGVLWPLLSYRLGQVNFRRHDYAVYRTVNQTFATALAPLLRSDDLIWIHDYQLLAVGDALRALGAEQRIGFFLHTPFPPPAIFCALPRAEELLEAMCACDVIGFHTVDYRDAFLQCVSVLLNTATNADGTFTWRGRRVTAIVDPIGIDVGGFAATAVRSVENAAARRLADSLGGRPLGVSADRLDYAKGLPNRVQALDHLFASHPEHRNHLIFLQVAAPSREELAVYRALRRELDRAVGDINGRYSEADWTPVRYLTRTVGRTTLAAYYRLARLGIVTPLRDGMNLVAKEYIAAQNAADPGVLILSRFAGAAEDMTDALIVNPFDAEEIAEAMHQGLAMPLDERQARHKSLLARIKA
ncbi:MAG TPA: trehalose-6-phosphate synthase, partial [Acetobacteraceae bacterium]|nr:trehalose-6-phosphate synthase [Acetobacteraceae bacterium]